MCQLKQDITVNLDFLAVPSQLVFRTPELIVRADQLDRPFVHPLLEGRVELTHFAFSPLALFARAEREDPIGQVIGQICILFNCCLGEDIRLVGVERKGAKGLPVRQQRK